MSRPSLPATTTSRVNPNQQQQPMNHNVDTSMGLLNSNHMIHLMSSSSSYGTISNSSSTTHQVFKQGYLSKKPLKAISSKSNFKYRFKGWKKRWFVLSRTSLYYYKDAAAAAAAQIQMQNLKNVVKTSNTSFHDSSSSQFGQLSDKYQPLGIISLVEDIKIEKDDLESTESGMFVFKIRTPYAVHLLAASTDLERKEWIDCIVGISGAIQMSKLVQYVTKLQVTIIEAKLNDELVQELNLSNHQESRSNNNHELVPAQNSNNQMLKQHSKNTSSTDNNNNDNKNNKNNKNNDNNKNNNVNTLNSTTRKSDVIENSQYQVSCKVKSNFQEFSTIAQSKTITPIWNETFVLDMPRFPMEIFLILELTETKETKVTNLLSHQQQQKKLTQFTQYSRNGLVKMTILEPDLVESVQAQQQESNDLVNLSYFQLTNQNASAAKSSFEVSFEKWFNAILEQDDGNDFIAKKKSQFVVDEDEDEDGEDGNNHGNEKHHHHNLMNELYEPAMTQLKRKKRNLGKIYARVEYIFEDMQGFPLSYQSIQNQIREAIRMQNELMNKILNGSQTRKENTSQKKLLGLYQDHFVEDEEEELKNKSKQNNKNSNTTTTTTTTPSNAPSSVDSLLNEQKKKHRRQLITRRYKQELDRVMSDRNAELLKRAQESQKTTLEMLQESIQDRKRQYENIENEYQRKEFEQQKKLQLKLKREEEQRLKEINKTLKQKEYEKKRQLSIQTNREKLLDERNRIIEILKFKAEKSKHFEKLHNAIKQEEERATQELASTIEKKEREFKLKAQRRIEENEEQMLRELDEKIKREEEFKAKKLRSEIAQLEKDMSKKLKELQERELQTKQMEEHQKQEYKRKIKELQKKVREEELNMLMRMQERLQNETAERQNEIVNEIDQFMKTQKENYEKQLKAFSKGGGAGGGNTSMTPPTTSSSSSTNLLSTDFSSLATISKPSASQLKLQAIFQVKTFDDISFKPVGIDVWKCGGFLHCYFIIERGILKVPTRKNANTITFKNNPEEYLKMNPKVPPPPGYIPPPPPVTASTPIVNTGGVFKMNITRKETSSLDKFEKASNGSGGSSGVIDLKDILAQKSKLKAATPNTATTNKSEPSTPIGMSNTLFTSLQMRRKQMAADSDDDDDTDEHNSTTLKHDTKQTNPMMAMLLSRIERLKREQKEILDEEAWEEEFGTSASKNKFQGGGAESSDTSTSEDSDW